MLGRRSPCRPPRRRPPRPSPGPPGSREWWRPRSTTWPDPSPRSRRRRWARRSTARCGGRCCQDGREVVRVGRPDDQRHQIFLTQDADRLVVADDGLARPAPFGQGVRWGPRAELRRQRLGRRSAAGGPPSPPRRRRSPVTVRLIRSLMSRPASRRACCTARTTSRARPSAASSGVTVVSRTTNPPPGSIAGGPRRPLRRAGAPSGTGYIRRNSFSHNRLEGVLPLGRAPAHRR